MTKSILQSEDECFFCKTTRALSTHHVVNGGGNRANSERYGLTVRLCAKHHEMIHQDQKLDVALKQYAQRAFEQEYSHEEWMQVFHKNYL